MKVEEGDDSFLKGDLEEYGDPKIASFPGGKIPKFLMITYILLPIWGFFEFYYFWNGSQGWTDRGYWHELQVAANTTFPIHNENSKVNTQEKEKQLTSGMSIHQVE